MMNSKPVLGESIRAGIYTGGMDVPSARFRARQYVAALRAFDIALFEHPSRIGQYPPASLPLRPGWLLAGLIERGMQIPASRRYDVVIFQRELISTLVTLEPLFGRPRILDVDDALWLHRRGKFARHLARKCDAVVCGNTYLANYFSRHCERTFVLPTAIDTRRFRPNPERANSPQIIGWSGTAGNLPELAQIEPALRIVLERFSEARLRIISDQPPTLHNLPRGRVEYVPWSREAEVSSLQDLSVGLMPLQDTAWARGKCAFKMLAYMACGIPVVVSPVGMNAEVLAKGNVGFGPTSTDDWVSTLSALLSDRQLARDMGDAGRELVESQYSVDALAGEFAEIIRTTLR